MPTGNKTGRAALLQTIFGKNRNRILVTYVLTLLENVFELNRRYSTRTLLLNRRLNNQFEREVSVLTRLVPSRVLGQYRLLGRWRIRLSDAEAINWGVMELFNIGLSAAVILRIASLHRIEPGTIYTMLAYLWNFIASLNNVPMLVQQLSRLKDIATRMEQSIISHKPVNGPRS